MQCFWQKMYLTLCIINIKINYYNSNIKYISKIILCNIGL